MSDSSKALATQLRTVSQAYNSVAEENAVLRSIVVVCIDLLPMSSDTKEPLHGSIRVSLNFRGPLIGKWTQRRLVSLDETTQKHFSLSRDRCLSSDAALMLLSSHYTGTFKDECVQAGTGALAKWNATKLILQSSLAYDAPFVLELGFSGETKALEWVEFTYDSEAIPEALDILKTAAVAAEEVRLTNLTLTELPSELETTTKKRALSGATKSVLRRRLVLE